LLARSGRLLLDRLAACAAHKPAAEKATDGHVAAGLPAIAPTRTIPVTLLQILILGLVQGAAELLPVSSSAHVIVAEKLIGLDPSTPEMTFLLVMLHTGTMFAVIAYFWKSWRRQYLSSRAVFLETTKQVVVATAATGVLGFGLKMIIEKFILGGGDIELLFSRLPLIAAALAVAGVLIIWSGRKTSSAAAGAEITTRQAAIVGLAQGFCLPFRGLSRSGTTISAGLLLGIERRRIEVFSFALVLVLTPPIIAQELLRLLKAHPEVEQPSHLVTLLKPGLAGAAFSFVGGLLALWLLSRLLESGRWQVFGYYCLAFAAFVAGLAWMGF
jgi:undecaprenyl-diphosphatase